jgi:hypothetical protein
MLEERQSVFPPNNESTHVGNIKKSGVFSGCEMLPYNTRAIMKWHMPTCKFHHFRSSMDMSVMENGLKQFFIDGNLSFNGGIKSLFKKIIVKGVLSVKLISCRRLEKLRYWFFCVIHEDEEYH